MGACLGSLRWRRTATARSTRARSAARGLADPAPMQLDTIFRIASMTKAVTGVAAMQCVERGKLSLDQPAGEIMPELAEPKVLEGFDADGKPILRAARRKITLRMLLTHTAGFVYHIWNAQLNRYYRGDRPSHDPVRPTRRAERAAGVRTRRAVGVWHQHRLGRTHGRDGERPGPRSVYAREHLRPPRHAGYRLHAHHGAVRALCSRSRPQARRIARPDSPNTARAVGVLRRRRCAVFDGS